MLLVCIVQCMRMTAVENADSFHGKQVVSSVRVLVNTTKECCGRIFSNHFDEKMGSPGVLFDETSDVVDESRDEDEGTRFGLLLEFLPCYDRKIGRVGGPSEVLLLSVEAFELHRELTFVNFVVREGLEVSGQAQLAADPDEPLGRIVLVPLERIAIVHRELMVKVMVTFTDGDQSSDHMVPGGMLVIKWRFSEPVCKRIDAECGVMNEHHSANRCVDKPAFPVSPSQTGDDRWDNDAHEKQKLAIVSVLPSDDGTL